MAAPWKTIPLFISSTFRDMHAERDQLNVLHIGVETFLILTNPLNPPHAR